MKLFLKKYKVVFIISIVTYLLFFIKLILPNQLIYSGRDSSALHYQSRIYLTERLKEFSYPYWSEKIFLGFPIYADMERGYLNVVNVLFVGVLGPFYSYKLLHFSIYLLGSISLYLFLRKYNVSYLGYAVSNIIYFFSFFLLYHQQHFNMVLTYYLFPTGLLLLDLFLDTTKYKYLIFNSIVLAFCFYWGSFQFVFLFILLELLYLFTLKKNSFLKNSFYTLLWFFIFSLPGIVVTTNLYLFSDRASSSVFTQGSISPILLVNTLFPFLFNFNDAYMGNIVSSEYLMHETYVYLGITTIVFSLISYLNLKDKKLKTFINILISVFICLSTIKYIPLLNNVNLLPFSLFRYWFRSVVFLNISLTILIGIFVTNLDKLNIFKWKLTDFKFLLYPLLYLIFIELINFGKTDTLTVIKLLARDDYIFGSWYFLWFIFLIVSFLLLKFFREKEIIASLIILDLLVFGHFASDNLIKNKKDILVDSNISEDLADTRLLDLRGTITGDNALLQPTWNLYGYSVLYPKSVQEKISNIGITSIRRPINLSNNIVDSLKPLGIQKVILNEGNVTTVNKYLISENNLSVSNYIQEEGYIKFSVDTTKYTKVDTYIRNYPGWTIYEDGKRIKKVDEDALFISFYIQKGEHTVEMKYIPIDLYLGIILAPLVGILGYLGFKKIWKS